jgi:integrase
MTFGQAAETYARQVETEPRLAESSKEFRLRPAATIRRTWPNLSETDVRKISADDCHNWQRRFENGAATYTPTGARNSVRGDSPTVINACIAYLRRVFEIALNEGFISENPALGLKRKPLKKKVLALPSQTQFQAIVAYVRRSQSRWAHSAADFIEGLAYSGMRLKEAARLQWTDINLEDGYMIVRGTKTATSSRRVPIVPAMRELLARIPRTGTSVFSAESALGSLAQACKAVQVHKLTHHDLRHYFATKVLESNVDAPTLALWLGHADGGVLAMKTYGHVRPLHSSEAAAKVKL